MTTLKNMTIAEYQKLTQCADGEPMKPIPLTIGGRRYRIMRRDPRNLVIESKVVSKRWRTYSYHGTVKSLAAGLVNLVTNHHHPDLDGTLIDQAAALRLAIEAGVDRLVADLAGLDSLDENKSDVKGGKL